MAHNDEYLVGQVKEQKLAYTIKEVQQLVGVGKTSIIKAIKERKLKVAKCGSRSPVLSNDLQDWLALLPRRLE